MLVFLVNSLGIGEDAMHPTVQLVNGELQYALSSGGDRIPDFSYCGYEAGSLPLPNVQTCLVLYPSGGDDTHQIQDAIDRIAQAPMAQVDSDQPRKWRGAILLAAGEFHISSTIYFWGSDMVLRGSGSADRPTTIVSTGYSRRPALVVGVDGHHCQRADCSPALPNGPGRASLGRSHEHSSKQSSILRYVPIGSPRLVVDNPATWNVGERVTVRHPSTDRWIAAVGMNKFPSDDGKGSWLDWKPGSRDQVWHRTIVAVQDNEVELDAPITSSLDPQWSQSILLPAVYQPAGHHLGVENLSLVSQSHSDENPMDEEHAWDGIRFSRVEDCWASHIDFRHFAGSAVHVGRNCRRITVADCHSSHPISEHAGGRRCTYHSLGQQTLFLRCRAEDGRHDFSVGPLTSGPNAFVHCSSIRSTEWSGPIGSWCSGVLYDNVEVDGAGLALTNRETEDAGAGQCAVNCVLWNCIAPEVICRQPPTGFNFAKGIWGQVRGDGIWRNLDQFTSPESLYSAQLSARIGQAMAGEVLTERLFPDSLTTYDQPQLPSPPSTNEDEGSLATRFSGSMETTLHGRPSSDCLTQTKECRPGRLQVKNGWLVFDDQLAIGRRQSMTWWRGSILPSLVEQFGAGLTRFVPGSDERYTTDPVADIAQQMHDNGSVALEHHWGLWYDRRRDDHLMVRRASGHVIPPFYEQPWARSGIGTAWDGMSKYDLHRFNRWYFDRLQQFAQEADRRDLILIQYMYFQHNLLESGAHWADFPWRPANCLQDTGFVEPPVYQNRKRIMVANEFYDISHPIRKELHVRYIRHCLDTLGESKNVIFTLGEEFTGPASFVTFWLDSVRNWMADTGRDVFIMLSTCRDAQETVLQDPNYSHLVDIVDVKYWWHTAQGNTYEPPSGRDLAPRQQLREWKGAKPSRSVDSLCRSVKEIRLLHPHKAVLCSIPNDNPWALLAAGASLSALPADCDVRLLQHVVNLQPTQNSLGYTLADSDGVKVAVLTEPAFNPSDGIPTPGKVGPKGHLRIIDSQTGVAHSESEWQSRPFRGKDETIIVWLPPGD